MINDERVSNQQQSLHCPVCGQALSFRIARGRKSCKPFLMVMCLQDGRHFRGFIGDRDYLAKFQYLLYRTPLRVRAYVSKTTTCHNPSTVIKLA